jgi:hypothetical protein
MLHPGKMMEIADGVLKLGIDLVALQEIRWQGQGEINIERMQDTAIPQKKMYGKLYATRRRGRPKMRWLDDVFMDLRKMGVNEWTEQGIERPGGIL